ncbi:hypothetical protein DH2020_007541 [Rehmannia glutinosa]|uniref:AB hydrolase-1 domain-containing protein n=1 Tax=Rehmannia glutinosa TaxID=99300 RepID=A0ABR0TZ49_REHGL
MSIGLRGWSKSSRHLVSKMAEEISSSAAATTTAATSKRRTQWLRWKPTSTDHIIAAEKRLLSLVKGTPTLVMVHGYGASQGFFFRNFDALANHFKVIAIDQLGWGGSSRPDFTCKSTEETEAWFIDSFEEWRKAKNLSNFILLGHSFGGYVAAKYALKHPEHVQHLILVGPAGFTSETEHKSEWLTRFRATWKGAILNHLWESNFTPQKLLLILVASYVIDIIKEMDIDGNPVSGFAIGHVVVLIWRKKGWEGKGDDGVWQWRSQSERVGMTPLAPPLVYGDVGMIALNRGFHLGLGPWGPDLVRKYTSARFGSYSDESVLNEDESRLLTDYVYHTLAAKGSGELCLKYIFSFGAFARKPLLHCASEWKVPTTFIYGVQDWMNYQGAQEARKHMNVPCEIIRVPQAGHFVFIDNPSAFHSATFYACRKFLSPDQDSNTLPEDGHAAYPNGPSAYANGLAAYLDGHAAYSTSVLRIRVHGFGAGATCSSLTKLLKPAARILLCWVLRVLVGHVGVLRNGP